MGVLGTSQGDFDGDVSNITSNVVNRNDDSSLGGGDSSPEFHDQPETLH